MRLTARSAALKCGIPLPLCAGRTKMFKKLEPHAGRSKALQGHRTPKARTATRMAKTELTPRRGTAWIVQLTGGKHGQNVACDGTVGSTEQGWAGRGIVAFCVPSWNLSHSCVQEVCPLCRFQRCKGVAYGGHSCRSFPGLARRSGGARQRSHFVGSSAAPLLPRLGLSTTGGMHNLQSGFATPRWGRMLGRQL